MKELLMKDWSAINAGRSFGQESIDLISTPVATSAQQKLFNQFRNLSPDKGPTTNVFQQIRAISFAITKLFNHEHFAIIIW